MHTYLLCQVKKNRYHCGHIWMWGCGTDVVNFTVSYLLFMLRSIFSCSQSLRHLLWFSSDLLVWKNEVLCDYQQTILWWLFWELHWGNGRCASHNQIQLIFIEFFIYAGVWGCELFVVDPLISENINVDDQ